MGEYFEELGGARQKVVPGFPALVPGFPALVPGFPALVPGFSALVPGFPALVPEELVALSGIYSYGCLLI